jgi:homoserine kinase
LTARRRVVRVPASSANLGPGYDVMAAALEMFLELEVEEVGEFSFDPGSLDVPTGRDNLIVRAFESLHSADGIAFRLKETIPLGRGLGSSAAAIVAGLVAADHLYELALSEEEMLVHATEIEGHPDNVAACLAGGLTIAYETAAGLGVARLTPLAELAPVVCVPAVPVATKTARQALPEQVTHADAAANSARAALLIAALTGRPDLLLAGTEDFLHQRYRASAMPRTATLVTALREAGFPAVVSGAGPSVLALTVDGLAGAADVERISAQTGAPWRVLPLQVDAEGARLASS